MFKLFHIDQSNIAQEVYPENGIYIVYELFEYKFQFLGEVKQKTVFIEDEIFDTENNLLVFTDDSISTKEKKEFLKITLGI
ncbi:hypothetical protein [Pedobacter sp. SL55]|uniref:hypothetical protein n=1 Tax=Pedobacter sp. SL55 TaxID=2995161 RepID=UPI00226F2D9F|nr:hypothetical protein [Pedobacter sp. SL55]WAC41863.1 hypothetical protein OVA16_05750 [Pedobacter sp. SL55]